MEAPAFPAQGPPSKPITSRIKGAKWSDKKLQVMSPSPGYLPDPVNLYG
jgi:hypothetical protein